MPWWVIGAAPTTREVPPKLTKPGPPTESAASRSQAPLRFIVPVRSFWTRVAPTRSTAPFTLGPLAPRKDRNAPMPLRPRPESVRFSTKVMPVLPELTGPSASVAPAATVVPAEPNRPSGSCVLACPAATTMPSRMSVAPVRSERPRRKSTPAPVLVRPPAPVRTPRRSRRPSMTKAAAAFRFNALLIAAVTPPATLTVGAPPANVRVEFATRVSPAEPKWRPPTVMGSVRLTTPPAPTKLATSKLALSQATVVEPSNQRAAAVSQDADPPKPLPLEILFPAAEPSASQYRFAAFAWGARETPTPRSAAATMREARDRAPRGRARRGGTDIKKG